MGRILALDYGEKRIGVAISDESAKIAFAKPHIEAGNFQALLDFINENEVQEIVVGYPLALSGKETDSTVKAKEFSKKIKTSTGLPVWLIDERLSTKEVLTELRDMGQNLKDSKEMIDSFVAQKMLERYLEKLQV